MPGLGRPHSWPETTSGFVRYAICLARTLCAPMASRLFALIALLLIMAGIAAFLVADGVDPLDVSGHRGRGWADCVGLCGFAQNPPANACAPHLRARGPAGAGTLGCRGSDHQREPRQALSEAGA